MTDDDAAALARVDTRLEAIQEDVVEIKKQVTTTNGRVSAIEMARAIEAALLAERAERAGVGLSRRQWTVNALIASAGLCCTLAALLLR